MSKMGLTDFHLSHNSRWHIYFWTCRLWERYVILIQGNFQEDLITYADTALPLLQCINCWRQSLSWCALVTFFLLLEVLLEECQCGWYLPLRPLAIYFLCAFVSACRCTTIIGSFHVSVNFFQTKYYWPAACITALCIVLFLHLMNDK